MIIHVFQLRCAMAPASCSDRKESRVLQPGVSLPPLGQTHTAGSPQDVGEAGIGGAGEVSPRSKSDARPFICASASATPVRHAFSFSNYNFVCQLRNHMTFVVDNLQQYFMADVLESQFSILIRSVDQSTNFEDLSIAHDNFLAAVLTHTFVNNKAVSCRLKQ